jgi:biopolymer transport protein ExbD
MKATLLLILFVVSVNGSAHARGPTTVDITTKDAGVSYTLHDYDMRIEKEHQTPEEIATWIREHAEGRKDQLVLVCPDAPTTYKTVFEMLSRLKAAGVKQFAIVTREGRNTHSLIGATDKIRSDVSGDIAPNQ